MKNRYNLNRKKIECFFTPRYLQNVESKKCNLQEMFGCWFSSWIACSWNLLFIWCVIRFNGIFYKCKSNAHFDHDNIETRKNLLQSRNMIPNPKVAKYIEMRRVNREERKRIGCETGTFGCAPVRGLRKIEIKNTNSNLSFEIFIQPTANSYIQKISYFMWQCFSVFHNKPILRVELVHSTFDDYIIA